MSFTRCTKRQNTFWFSEPIPRLGIQHLKPFHQPAHSYVLHRSRCPICREWRGLPGSRASPTTSSSSTARTRSHPGPSTAIPHSALLLLKSLLKETRKRVCGKFDPDGSLAPQSKSEFGASSLFFNLNPVWNTFKVPRRQNIEVSMSVKSCRILRKQAEKETAGSKGFSDFSASAN